MSNHTPSSQNERDAQRQRAVEHLLTLARRGKSGGASGGEKRARKIVLAILNNVTGLDGTATSGIGELAKIVSAAPMEAGDAVKKAID